MSEKQSESHEPGHEPGHELGHAPDAGAETQATAASAEEAKPRAGVSRRALLTGTGLGVVGGALAGGGITWATTNQDGKDTIELHDSVPFYGQAHPAGVQTPPQRYLMFMTFNVKTTSRQQLQTLLARWTAAAGLLQKGDAVGSVEPTSEQGVPKDTGEAYGLAPASLTVTIGLGPSLFAPGRFGLENKRPSLLADLPALPSDNFDPALTGGDLSVQACADDPQVVYHAVRNLARIGRGLVETHWTQMGFGRASAGPGQQTPRNLMGFKDGTRNITTDDDYEKFVWSDGDGQDWFAGGTYQVVRKIHMSIETWDADRIGDQQTIFGRTKGEGAPLTGSKEFDDPDFAATDDHGERIIDVTSHIALAAHENNDGVKVLRRSYNYTDGLNPHAQLDAGLVFITYQNDPEHFARLQRRLGASDLLNEYISHIGSGIFAIPPSPKEGRYIGQELFEG